MKAWAAAWLGVLVGLALLAAVAALVPASPVKLPVVYITFS